ncbi:MAG TPA: DUF3108 domain-containing protein [Aromatoleum sp.]|uniref:DUF3108 domain-containing protein n=1 Tax=Aromatoleum sp. TaxID=2307007 RepID=UPI002B486B23|nr:DUF3108 domain-containing protein [Aromatoleum sp.]HJV26573.1 DUF3108 domain-containing protein [Aromatoleum sp.]
MHESKPYRSPAVPRRLLIALGLSLLLHALLFVGTRLDLRPPPDLQPLDVTLVRTLPKPEPLAATAQPAPAAEKKPSHPKPPPKKPEAAITDKPIEAPEPPAEPPKPEPAAETAAAPENVATTDTPAGPTDSAAAATTPSPDAAPGGSSAWPRAGRIGYAAFMGERRYPMGRNTHQWEIKEDGSYEFSALSEPVTVNPIPWFQPGRKLWESTGHFTAAGLRPDRFVERQEGRPGELAVEMDWNKGEIRSAAGTAPLPENAQDTLSFLYQIGYPGAVGAGDMAVTTGGPLQSYRLEQIGEEPLQMPWGQVWRTLHLRASYGTGREMTDVWIAIEHFSLPVQIRTIDPKGVIYYLLANDIRISRDTVAQMPAR